MPYPNEHSCRLKSGSYVRYARDNDKDPNHIYGIRKSDQQSELISYRYPRDRWDIGRAREHCKSHEGTFEPAGDIQSMEHFKSWEQGLTLAAPKKWYLVIPEGQYEHPTYGHLDFNEEFLQELVTNFYGKALGNTEPFVDIGHNEEEAVGWFKELRLIDEGMEGLIAWNDKGVELLESGQYKYFSPWISAYKNPETGQEYANVFRGGALTNVPFLKMLPEITLGEKKLAVEIKLSELEIHKGGNMDILQEIKKMLKVEKDEEVVAAFQEFFKTAGESEAEMKKKDIAILALEEKIKEFETKIKELDEAKGKGSEGSGDKDIEAVKEQLKEVTKSNKKLAEVLHVMKKEKIIGIALREAKIMPADADKWRKFYDQNPELIEDQIKVLPVLIELKTKGNFKGTERQPDATKLTDPDKEVAEQLGLTEDDYKENLEADLGKNPAKKKEA